MKIRNYTPHPIVLVTDEGNREFEACGSVARLTQDYQEAGAVAGLPVVTVEYGPVTFTGLAPEKTGAGAVRDADGRIIGVRRFILYPYRKEVK